MVNGGLSRMAAQNIAGQLHQTAMQNTGVRELMRNCGQWYLTLNAVKSPDAGWNN